MADHDKKEESTLNSADDLSTGAMMLQKCDECSNHQALYVCPRCSFRSCSLACCVAHKKRTKCNGKRIIATENNAYLSLSRMNDNTLKQDYHFLEHVLQTVESNQRKRPPTLLGGGAGRHHNRKRPRHQQTDESNTQPDESNSSEPAHPLLQRQQESESSPTTPSPASGIQVAWGGGGRNSKFKNIQRLAGFPHRRVQVMFMSPGMQRPLSNKSYVKKQTIHWTVECIVHPPPRADEKSMTQELESCSISASSAQSTTETKRPFQKSTAAPVVYKFLTNLDEGCRLQEELIKLIQQRQTQLRKLNARDPTIEALLSSIVDKTSLGIFDGGDDGDNVSANHSQVDREYEFLLHQPRSRNYRTVAAPQTTTLREALNDTLLLEFPTFHWVPKKLCTTEQFPRLVMDVIDTTANPDMAKTMKSEPLIAEMETTEIPENRAA